jgi:hypothetical protein
MLASWKAASSTLHLRLEPYNDCRYSRFYYYNPLLQRVVHQHITYAEFAALPENNANYLTAAFVRNPYDRVYSGFLQLQRDFQRQPFAEYPSPWIKSLVIQQLAETSAQLAAAEFDFNRWFGLVEEYQIYDIGRNSSFPLHPAHYWTGRNREIEVDFIGKVESFEDDFDAFCGKVGIQSLPRESDNRSNIQRDSPERFLPRYIHLMNSASIGKINTIFHDDFELFGYEKHCS